MDDTQKPKRGGGRIARTLRSLLYIGLVGVGLILWNAYNTRRDVARAIGPASDSQRQFFDDAADRPDIAEFFKKTLTHSQRVAMAENIGRYDDAPLAKLCAVLLADFDAQARQALAASLTHVALKHPEAVAAELNRTGSFQYLGIARALRSCGTAALPLVAAKLSDAGSRPNAEAFLVSAGKAAVPFLVPMLGNDDKDTRLAAADTLGKIGDPAAVQGLLARFRNGPAEERAGYLSALAGIGDPSTEPLMEAALRNDSLPTQERAQAALGLGRVVQRSPSNKEPVLTLWSFASSPDSELRSAVLGALRLCGDAALAAPDQDESVRLQVASGLNSETANQTIRRDLRVKDLRIAAAEASRGRPALEPALLGELGSLNPATEGEFADALVDALTTTAEGKAAVLKERSRPVLDGFIARRLQLGSSG